jgi:hypothetical protein
VLTRPPKKRNCKKKNWRLKNQTWPIKLRHSAEQALIAGVSSLVWFGGTLQEEKDGLNESVVGTRIDKS